MLHVTALMHAETITYDDSVIRLLHEYAEPGLGKMKVKLDATIMHRPRVHMHVIRQRTYA